MKKPARHFKEWLIWTLRKSSYRWPARSEAFRRAQVTRSQYEKRPGIKNISDRIRNFYRCELCRKVFPRKQVSADHIAPVIDPKKGWQGWDEYLSRLFCPASGFQIICKTDHDKKTARESRIRALYRRKKRK